MKKPKSPRVAPAAAPAAGALAPAGIRPWHIAAGAAGALLLLTEVYSPALHGPFILDDLTLPFGRPDFDRTARHMWTDQRPVLMGSYYINMVLTGQNTFSYHLANVVLHWLAALLAFFLFRRLFERAGEVDPRRSLLALAGAGLFLLHPIQTEAVAYIASRSDVLSTLFCYAALTVFFFRQGDALTWPRAAGVLLLLGLAAGSKENAAALAVVFVLADYYFYPGFSVRGVLGNWRLYLPVVAGGLYGVVLVRNLLRNADTVGFSVSGITWYQYFFTECRAIWLYLRLMVLPMGQNLDPDFPFSKTIWEHGAFLGLLALLAVTGAAWFYRRQFPLASFGWLATLILLAPTSSFLVIKDPVAERRMYLPMFFLLLAVLDLARRWIVPQGQAIGSRVLVGLGAILMVCAGLSFARADVYGSAEALWKDTTEKSPNKVRPHFQLGYSYYEQKRCNEAVAEYQRAEQLEKPDYTLLIDHGLALDCAGKSDDAIDRFRRAGELERGAHPYALIGMIYGKQGKSQEALQALEEAQKRDPSFAMTYVYRGNVFAARGDWKAAAEQFRLAVANDPFSTVALESLQLAQRNLRQGQ